MRVDQEWSAVPRRAEAVAHAPSPPPLCALNPRRVGRTGGSVGAGIRALLPTVIQRAASRLGPASVSGHRALEGARMAAGVEAPRHRRRARSVSPAAQMADP